MRIFPNGWCDEAAIRPSEHFNERPEGEEISLLVIHNISLPAGQFGTGRCRRAFLAERLTAASIRPTKI